MATSNDIKKGLCIEFSNDIYKVIEFLHVKPGKGPAFVRTKLKSVTNGKVIDNTFSAGHKIDEVKVITRKFQYLYDDENGFHFMNNEDFSQMYLNKERLIQFCKKTEMNRHPLQYHLQWREQQRLQKRFRFTGILEAYVRYIQVCRS